MLHLSASCTCYFYNQPTDMRKSFNSLSGLISNHMQLNALSGGIFIFINKKRNQIKLLHWEGDGFAIYFKRLERGTYDLPITDTGYIIASAHLQLLLQGIQLKQIHYKKRYQRA
jgi:transposase